MDDLLLATSCSGLFGDLLFGDLVSFAASTNHCSSIELRSD